MNKLLIFDLDGTLVNTVMDLNAGINYSLKMNGYPLKSIEHTSKAIGNGISITLYRSLPIDISEEEHAKILKDFRYYYKDHYLDNSLPYEGMLDTLKEFKKRGFVLAVVTNKLDSIAKQMIYTLFPNIFDIVQGDKEGLPKKPDPSVINLVIEELKFDKSDVFYIGDSEVDIETANNAGIKLVLVDYGFHRSYEYLKDSRGVHVQKPEELLKVI